MVSQVDVGQKSNKIDDDKVDSVNERFYIILDFFQFIQKYILVLSKMISY